MRIDVLILGVIALLIGIAQVVVPDQFVAKKRRLLSPPFFSSARYWRWNGVALSLVGLLAIVGSSGAWAQTASLTDDERAVLSAAVSSTRVAHGDKVLIIVNDTASFRCDGNHNVKAGGCNGGMRTQDQTTEDIISWLGQVFPGIGLDLLADFRVKNQYRATVSRALDINAKQSLMNFDGSFIAGESLQNGTQPSDALVTVSRVGFNHDKTEALAYIGGFGMNNSKRSYGEYLHLSRVEGRWNVKGHARMWDLGKTPSR